MPFPVFFQRGNFAETGSGRKGFGLTLVLTHSTVERKKTMRGARLAIFLTCALAFFVLLPAPNPRAESVRFALGWVPFGRDAGWFAAVEKGFYAAEGLQVTISRGFGGADSIQKLGAGTFDVGMTDPGSLLLGRAKGIKIKMVGMYHDKAPFVLRWLEGSGINSLKDLEGKTVGAPAGDSNPRSCRP